MAGQTYRAEIHGQAEGKIQTRNDITSYVVKLGKKKKGLRILTLPADVGAQERRLARVCKKKHIPLSLYCVETNKTVYDAMEDLPKKATYWNCTFEDATRTMLDGKKLDAFWLDSCGEFLTLQDEFIWALSNKLDNQGVGFYTFKVYSRSKKALKLAEKIVNELFRTVRMRYPLPKVIDEMVLTGLFATLILAKLGKMQGRPDHSRLLSDRIIGNYQLMYDVVYSGGNKNTKMAVIGISKGIFTRPEFRDLRISKPAKTAKPKRKAKAPQKAVVKPQTTAELAAMVIPMVAKGCKSKGISLRLKEDGIETTPTGIAGILAATARGTYGIKLKRAYLKAKKGEPVPEVEDTVQAAENASLSPQQRAWQTRKKRYGKSGRPQVS